MVFSFYGYHVPYFRGKNNYPKISIQISINISFHKGFRLTSALCFRLKRKDIGKKLLGRGWFLVRIYTTFAIFCHIFEKAIKNNNQFD